MAMPSPIASAIAKIKVSNSIYLNPKEQKMVEIFRPSQIIYIE